MAGDEHGVTAERPTDIPARGWRDVLMRTKDRIKAERVGLMAAGVAFYSLLAIFPALIAAVTVWGLVADPGQIEETIAGFAGALPQGADELLIDQVGRIADAPTGGLSLALAISLIAALWSASTGIKGLMNGLNAVYEEPEERGFLKERGLAIALTLGAILLGLVAIGLIAVLPAVVGALGLPEQTQTVALWIRWPVLALFIVLALAIVYRHGPDRSEPKWRWVSWGAGIATAIWLIASAGFAWYVNVFGAEGYAETYGSMAGVIVLMLWLFLSAFAALVGACIDAELELQTAKDTTEGEPQPMGERGARVADRRP